MPSVEWRLREVRRTGLYRASVWGIRVAPVGLAALCVNAERLMPVALGATALAWALTVPFQIFAYWELEIPRGQVALQQLQDVFNPRFY